MTGACLTFGCYVARFSGGEVVVYFRWRQTTRKSTNMPRRSAAELAAPTVRGRPARLAPPPSLSTDARTAFLAIVGSVEPEHFKPVDAPLVCRLAVAQTWSQRAEAELERDRGVVDGKPSPWIAILEKQVKTSAMLATRLRLTPQSRYDARAAARTAKVRIGPAPWEI
jgi:hypothetical protein